jgi:predicted alpha-1,2-mannosidase
MKKFIRFPVFLASLFIFVYCHRNASEDSSDIIKPKTTGYVNPFMGTIEGNILPGASVPFGMVKLSPDVLPPQPTSGYRPGQPIAGFSHTHTSGTGGGPRYGNIMVFPQVGTPDINDYASVKIANERAFPGYYAVTLRRVPGDVHVELTATQKTGKHKYTFFTWQKEPEIEGSIFIDVAHTVTRAGLNDARCLEAFVEITDDNIIRGWGVFQGGWGTPNPYKIYFAALFDTPFQKSGIWDNDGINEEEHSASVVFNPNKPVKERRMGAYAGFDLKHMQTIELSVGISYLSMNKATENLKEKTNMTFDQVYAQTDQLWEEKLSTIEVEGGLPEHKQVFYSSLRNTFLMPTEVTGEIENWHTQNPHFWDHYCIWDVFRTVMPLHTLIAPHKQREILNSLLDIYDQRGWLPDSWVAGDFSNIQGGTNVDVVFADAVVKGLDGFDVEKALEATRKNAEKESDDPTSYGRYLQDYLNLGYVTSESVNGASSRTLEYAYNDFCIAQIAAEKGKEDLAREYRKRSQEVFQLFHDSAGHFWAKDRQGNWQPDITSDNLRRDHWNDPYFYEATPLAYSSYVPHDMQGLINRHGGNNEYIEYLDRLFDGYSFNLGNEPLFLLPYQYIYAGRHDKTSEHVQDLLRTQYLSATDGLPGQDDSGAISSWFVFSSMGFFPVAGQDLYLIGSPLFKRSVIHLENNNTFQVLANNVSHENIYIKSARLNGENLEQAWFTHTEIAKGGVLELEMTDQPTSWASDNPPPSLSKP